MEELLKAQSTFIDFVLKEWLVIASGVGLVLTSIYTRHFPAGWTPKVAQRGVVLLLTSAFRSSLEHLSDELHG